LNKSTPIKNGRSREKEIFGQTFSQKSIEKNIKNSSKSAYLVKTLLPYKAVPPKNNFKDQ